jgi:hypothetical protein
MVLLIAENGLLGTKKRAATRAAYFLITLKLT